MASTNDDSTYHYYLTVVLLISALWLFIKGRKKDSNLPPGPTPYPLVGNLLQVGKDPPHLTFMRWAKKYGPVMSLKLGSESMVILSDAKIIKEVFSNPVTSGRNPENPISMEYCKGDNGIANSEGATSEAQRRFTFKTLKEFGFAKSSMEGMIMEDVAVTINWLKERQNKPIKGNKIFNSPVANTLWNIVSGQRCEWVNGTSEFVLRAERLIRSFTEVTGNGLYYAPFLRYIVPDMMGWNTWVKVNIDLAESCKMTVQEHNEKWDEANLKDYIDYYLYEIKKEKDPKSSFYKERGHTNLLHSVIDLFIGGSETTATSLEWSLLYLSSHQAVQEKVHKEIDSVLRSSNGPSLSDKTQLPYVEATIMEILRVSSVLPLALPHRLISDFTICGYTLEKHTMIMANTYGLHHDPDVWGDPENFRPERFLNEDGTKVVKHEAYMPFSEGKRKCIGETLAKDSLFLYFTSIFQHFQVMPDPQKPNADFGTEGVGFVLQPKPFNIVLTPRK